MPEKCAAFAGVPGSEAQFCYLQVPPQTRTHIRCSFSASVSRASDAWGDGCRRGHWIAESCGRGAVMGWGGEGGCSPRGPAHRNLWDGDALRLTSWRASSYRRRRRVYSGTLTKLERYRAALCVKERDHSSDPRLLRMQAVGCDINK